jgi:hypothetical protein
MGWKTIAKPAFIVGQFVRGFLHGAGDEIIETFTDAEITRFKDISETLQKCDPWDQHLEEEAYEKINQALKKENYKKAREAIDKNSKDTANPICITILKMAVVEVATKCTTLLLESLPTGIIISKN